MTHRMLMVVALVVMMAGPVRAGEAAASEGRMPPYPLGPLVLLADGGVIAATIESIDEKGLAVRSPLLGRFDLPWTAMRGYRASLSPGPGAIRDPDGQAGERAILRLSNGDEMAAAGLSLDKGRLTVKPVSGMSRPIEIPWQRVRAIQWSAPGSAPGSAAAGRRLVALADGSRFFADLLPVVCDPADIVVERRDGGAVVSLVSQDPIDVEQGGGGEPRWPIVRNATLAGGWPSARGTTGFTGLGIHAPARLRYRFERPPRRFESIVAIDDSAGQGGSVVVRILAIDASGRSREVHASPVLRGGDEPHPIGVDLDAAVELEIAIDPADVGSVLDRTIWLDPRVIVGTESR